MVVVVVVVVVVYTYIHTYIQHVLFPQFHTASLLKKYGTCQCMPVVAAEVLRHLGRGIQFVFKHPNIILEVTDVFMLASITGVF